MEREIRSVRVEKCTRSKQRKEKGVYSEKKKARGVVCGGKRERRERGWKKK